MMLLNGMGNYKEQGKPSPFNNTNTSSSSSRSLFLPTLSNSNDGGAMVAAVDATTRPPLMFSSWKPTTLSQEATNKALAACKSHKEAERRRRRRINAHLATLRTLLPHLIKTDKASVLSEVVQRVRELKESTSKLTSDRGDGDTTEGCLFPGDTDEVKLCRSENDDTVLVATLCCEDRPQLFVEMTRALRSIKAKVVRAEMATVGGRTKTILWVRSVGGGSGGGGGSEGLLKRALKVVVDKPFSSFGMGHHGPMGSRILQGLY